MLFIYLKLQYKSLTISSKTRTWLVKFKILIAMDNLIVHVEKKSRELQWKFKITYKNTLFF